MSREFKVAEQKLGRGVRSLVEASAGTGKTYNIENLYLRLLLEGGWKGLGVSDILVVTFTEAATAELSGRVRDNIARALDLMSEGSFPEWLGGEALDGMQRQVAIHRLRTALASFDEAAIMTIHGFCGRMLGEFTFETGMPFSIGLVTDSAEFLEEAVNDFFRRYFYAADAALLCLLAMDFGVNRESLLGLAAKAGECPDLKLAGIDDKVPEPRRIRAELEWHYGELRGAWKPELSAELAGLGFKADYARRIAGITAILADGLGNGRLSGGLFRTICACARGALEGGMKVAFLKQWTPSSALSRFIDECSTFAGVVERLTWQLKCAFVEFMLQEKPLERYKNELQVRTYSDLLLNMRAALSGDNGETLAALVRRRFPVALIDEFQDTDPVQYEIFSRVFDHPDCMMVMVGDPKQSIYSFRGADVFAYLDVSVSLPPECKSTLVRNFRSSSALLRAFNALFGSGMPFADARIEYIPAEAGRPQAELYISGAPCSNAPLELWMGGTPGAKALSRENGRRLFAAAVARRIAGMLYDAASGGTYFMDGDAKVALRASDIAVLVYTHGEASEVRGELLRRGVNAVVQASGNIFATPEARDMLLLLEALANPGDESAVKSALCGLFIGVPAPVLCAYAEDGECADEYEYWLELFAGYRRIWERDGFIRMFSRFLLPEGESVLPHGTPRRELLRKDVRSRLLRRSGGERLITNVLHLAELIHKHARAGNFGVSSTLEYVREALSAPENNEEHEQRLESDRDAVRIMTVFKSKGLQFPVVFCPFAWASTFSGYASGDFVFHDHRDGMHGRFLELGSKDFQENLRCYYRENLSEKLRLLYVALTRARNFCVVCAGNVSGAQESAIAYLAENPDAENLPEAMENGFNKLGGGMVPESWLKAGLKVNEPCIEESPKVPCWDDSGELACLEFHGRIPRDSGIMSFSSIVDDSHASADPDPDMDDSDEIPDDESGALPEVPSAAPGTLPLMAGFPKGAVSGDCIHNIFERIDFGLVRRPGWSNEPAYLSLLEEQLRRAGRLPGDSGSDVYAVTLDLRCRQLGEMIGNTLSVPLTPGGVCLCDIPECDRLAEMSFFFKVSERIRGDELNVALKRLGLMDFRDAQGLLPESRGISFKSGDGPRRGHMTGKIDLFFRHDGKYYLLDWKTTWLGDRYMDYTSDKLLKNMFDSSYVLQYCIYTLAADKYLSRRLQNYDYERDFGGVFYLYVRGIDGKTPDTGVFYDKPSAELLNELKRIFPGGGDDGGE